MPSTKKDSRAEPILRVEQSAPAETAVMFESGRAAGVFIFYFSDLSPLEFNNIGHSLEQVQAPDQCGGE